MKRTAKSKPTFSEIVARTWPQTRKALESKAVLASRLAHASTDPAHKFFFYRIKHSTVSALCMAAQHPSITAKASTIRVDVDDRLLFRGARVFRVRLRSKLKLHVPEIFASPVLHDLAQVTALNVMARGQR
jgi:hypothetical protein